MPTSADRRLVSEVEACRREPGCLEAEAYRSITDPDEVAVVQLWNDEPAHDAYLVAVESGRLSSLPLDLATADDALVEAYAHEYAAPVDGVWTAASRAPGNRIMWPARGAVRIIIQSCFAEPDAEKASLIANEIETLREPGCEEFAWMQSIEDNRHILLLELWTNQRLYDQHWDLRQRTAVAGTPRKRAERAHGTNGAEFYRHQPFRTHYGHWLPADDEDRATTIAWPA